MGFRVRQRLECVGDPGDSGRARHQGTDFDAPLGDVSKGGREFARAYQDQLRKL